MEEQGYVRHSFLAEGSEYPEPDPGYTPVYPWAGTPTEPTHDRLSVCSGLNHGLRAGNEALGELEDSYTDRPGLNSVTDVAGNVYVDPYFECVDGNSM